MNNPWTAPYKHAPGEINPGPTYPNTQNYDGHANSPYPANMNQMPNQNHPPPMYGPTNRDHVPGAVVTQPQIGNFDNFGSGYIPTGLEYLGSDYLANLDSIFIKQKMELLEAMTGWETENKYEIKNSAGQTVFYALEHSECCSRFCCGSCREFKMRITNFAGQELLRIDRPKKCKGCCYPCCLQTMIIEFPPGNPVGSIDELWSCCANELIVKDSFGQIIYDLKGPNACSMNCCPPTMCGNDIVFEVFNHGETTSVGTISKKFSGIAKEYFTDADNFQTIFPTSISVEKKALLIGATFLVDFMYFENNQGHRN